MKVKIIAVLCASILCAFVVLSVLPVNGEGQIYDDMIRLHVIANSDSNADQALKLKVRDGVLKIVSEFEEKAKDEVLTEINAHIKDIIYCAEAIIKDNGLDYKVSCEIGLENYPERNYDGFTLPAGTYTSFRVIIGSGEGHNWWCVLYPPLCTAAAEKREEVFIAAGFTDKQYKTITETDGVKYKVKFKLLEIIQDILTGQEKE